MNYTLPGARAGYRAIVEGLDLATSAGQSAYVTLMALSEYADTYYSYLETAQQEFLDAQQKFLDAQQKLIDAQGTIVSTVQGYVDKLKSARESLKMEGSITAAQSLSSAKLAFNAVLEQARTGDLSGIAS